MNEKSHAIGKDRVQISDRKRFRDRQTKMKSLQAMPRLQTAAKCALADLLGEYERGGLPEPARRSILELYDALVGCGVDMDDYREKVKQIRALRD